MWFQNIITWNYAQLRLYYIYLEIAIFCQKKKGFNRKICTLVWNRTRFESPMWFQNIITWNYAQLRLYYIYLEIAIFCQKKKGFNRKICNTKASLFFIFLKFDWILQTALEVWLVGFIDAFWSAGQWRNLENKLVRFLNKSHCWERIRPQGSPVISKWYNKEIFTLILATEKNV